LANTRSAEKRNRQALKRRMRNIQARTAIKSSVKKARESIAQGDSSAVKASLQVALRTLDKAASKGVIHKNAASRRIARLAKAAAKAQKQPATPAT
jgi:small subunit ribosomal protein S20